MQADLVFIAQRGCDSALRGRILELALRQHYYASSARQFNRGTQAGNSRADYYEISFGWSALHMQKCYHFACTAGCAYDYVMMNVHGDRDCRGYSATIRGGNRRRLLDRAGRTSSVIWVWRGRPRPRTVSPTGIRHHRAPGFAAAGARKLLSSLAAAQFNAQVIEMRDGEPHKKLATVEALAEKMLRRGAGRDAMIVAFGGGVVGDTAGLLASLYMRGVDLVQIPTTVLAQFDASIGGKTGVNLRGGKNLLGTFQPAARGADRPFGSRHVAEREFRAGYNESLKCGVIGDPELFEFLEKADVSSFVVTVKRSNG